MTTSNTRGMRGRPPCASANKAWPDTRPSWLTCTRFKQKDPRGFADFVQRLAEHPDAGAANTMENYQGARPSLYDFEGDWKKLALPTLIICGDEDEPCVQPSLYLKRVLPNAGLAMFAKTGHALNSEEPDAFNRELWNFLALVEADKWTPAAPVDQGATLV
jgi:3-oxoadipate enol-lactonase